MRTNASPVPSGLEDIDRALRQVAAQATRAGTVDPPRLLMARPAGSTLELHLAEPASPPPGVVALDATTWAVPMPDDLDTPRPVMPFWPGLTALGTGCYGNKVLLNLAAASPLTVTTGSGSNYAAQVLRAISLDLVRSPWAASVRLHLVGFGAEVAATRPDRVDYFEHLAEAVEQVAQQCWLATHPDEQQQAPQPTTGTRQGLHVLLCAYPSETHRDQLHGLLRLFPHHVAAALADTDMDKDGARQPGSVLDTDRSRLCADGASWIVNPRRVAAEDYAQAASTLPPPGHTHTSSPRRRARPIPIHDETPRPEVRLLGPPQIAGVDTSTVEQNRLAQITQLVAYLALRPGATAAQIGRTLYPDAADPAVEAHGRASRARTLLGTEHLPSARDRSYHLRGIRLDINEFERLIHRATAQTPVWAATDLEQALALVRGRPLEDEHPHRRHYDWALHIGQQYLATILDTHHTLAQLYLDARRPSRAADTARNALQIAELHPTATQDLLRALHASHLFDELRRSTEHYAKTCTQRGLTPDPDTLQLAHDLLHPPR